MDTTSHNLFKTPQFVEITSGTCEDRIASWLRLANISFTREKTYSGLLGWGGRLLRFDFCLLFDGFGEVLLEYHGPFHHFRDYACRTNDDMEYASLNYHDHDFRKANYARHHHIPIIYLYIGGSQQTEFTMLFERLNFIIQFWEEKRQERECQQMGMEDKVLARKPPKTTARKKTVLKRQGYLEQCRDEYCIMSLEAKQLSSLSSKLSLETIDRLNKLFNKASTSTRSLDVFALQLRDGVLNELSDKLDAQETELRKRKLENAELESEIKELRKESRKLKAQRRVLVETNSNMKSDICLLKAEEEKASSYVSGVHDGMVMVSNGLIKNDGSLDKWFDEKWERRKSGDEETDDLEDEEELVLSLGI